jgi:hypothetical protein
METSCIHCGTRHVLKETDLGSHARVQFRCSKCRQATVVEVTRRPDTTMVVSPLPLFARANAPSSDLSLPAADPGLRLPTGAQIVLTVLSGPAKGAVHILKKPRVVIGRQGADIPLNDPEISRHHCLLEVRDTFVNLRDMDSTNGTFFDDERVRAAVLQDGTEFRIGETVIRLNVQPK